MSKELSPIEESPEMLPEISRGSLPDVMQQAADRAGWTELMPVQSKIIPYLRRHRDVMVQAQTGSGKTGAFVLPILERINKGRKTCQALILVPTRELAQQVAADARLLAGDTGVRVVAVYGGSSYKPQIEAFQQGAHLVVGTPGRILDHLIHRNLTFEHLETLIFDEADRLMSMGFFPDMARISQFLPGRPINSCMFSATFPIQVMSLAQRFLDKPEFLSLSQEHIHVLETNHAYYMVPAMDKDRALVRIIEFENPHQAIVFCNTKDRVFYVTSVLQRFGYNADQLSSDLSQSMRDEVLTRLRDGRLRFLVATDVAARGIDIPALSHVIQYEPSEDLEAYIHRAGRTGRAGAAGTAIMLLSLQEKKYLTRIAAYYNIQFEERSLPSDEDVQTLVGQRLVAQLEARLRERDKLQVERMQRFIPLAREIAEDDDALAVLAMLLDDTYHEWMHHPPEMEPIGTTAKRPEGRRKDSGSQWGGGKRTHTRGGQRTSHARGNPVVDQQGSAAQQGSGTPPDNAAKRNRRRNHRKSGDQKPRSSESGAAKPE
ncbi:MAG: DEAD/DEAH box helicase [Chloroflexi bacterium]|nr:DEAD/DEAH box helicase [Chloroflexota bacterium]